ncbi:MAG: hypothetical protein KH062_09920 [Streptococcus sp.]|uniref:hypothetical protein n=1 Tax=Streptococcus sp. TaxID=1306 RepID=UPI0025FF391F|nr:hypothetical protein [Streptococcus sp.]MBS7138686.1 hypothetical protein [Streptococcus sp.]
MGLDRESVGVRMSLVYNNDKPIGKCESYSIDKVPGTTPFVMLTNYEPLRSELNENQQVVLEWLQIYADKDSGDKPFQTIFFLWDCIKSNNLGNDELTALRKLTRAEQLQVLAAFAEWGMKEVAE